MEKSSRNKPEPSPLDTPYNRLDEAHRAWHLALQGYHSIDDFRAGINSAIQALRNVTFAIQKQKDNLPGFDEWYAGWQKKMSADPILKALVQARNTIVKEEDLKLHSTAIARTQGWVDFEKTAFTFDPMKNSMGIAAGFYNAYAKHLPVPEEGRKRLIFKFERKWVYDQIPDSELLEALAHAYHFFHEMLTDASKKFGAAPRTSYSTGDYCDGDFNDANKLQCMSITSDTRTLAFSFDDGRLLQPKTKAFSKGEADMEKAKKRYGDEWKSKKTLELLEGVFEESYPFSHMKLLAQAAVSSFKKDKYLIPVSFIFKEKNSVPISLVLPFMNHEEKVLSIDKIATEIIKNRGKNVLFMSEIWQYERQEDFPKIPTRESHRGAKEALQISYMSANKMRAVRIPFHRSLFLRKIVYGTPEIEDFPSDDHPNFIFNALIEALKQVG